MKEKKKIDKIDKTDKEDFVTHLSELRKRIIQAGVVIILVFFSIVYWTKDIFQFLAYPLLRNFPSGGKMIVTDISGSFFVPMKITIIASFIIALPYVLYQMWAFVSPGLYLHEKQFMLPLIFSSYVLFLVGIAFAYFIVFPTIFKIMASYNSSLGVEMSTDISNYLSFIIATFLCFGTAFEIPIVIVMLVYLEFLSTSKLREIRPYVIVSAFIIAAIITPPDAFSQLILAIPILLLYEIGLISAILLKRYKNPKV